MGSPPKHFLGNSNSLVLKKKKMSNEGLGRCSVGVYTARYLSVRARVSVPQKNCVVAPLITRLKKVAEPRDLWGKLASWASRSWQAPCPTRDLALINTMDSK